MSVTFFLTIGTFHSLIDSKLKKIVNDRYCRKVYMKMPIDIIIDKTITLYNLSLHCILFWLFVIFAFCFLSGSSYYSIIFSSILTTVKRSQSSTMKSYQAAKHFQSRLTSVKKKRIVGENISTPYVFFIFLLISSNLL